MTPNNTKLDLNVFNSFPNLQTKRLSLRELSLNDARAILRMRSNERINEFIPRELMNDVSSAKELVQKCHNAFKVNQGISWAGEQKEDGRFIGSCGFNRIDFSNNRAEIGGELTIEKWGQLLAIEAVSEILNFGFDKLNLHSVEAKVDTKNRGAVYLMKKLGFKKEAHFREAFYHKGNYLDMTVYGLLRKDFIPITN